jgi:hypothetical protein
MYNNRRITMTEEFVTLETAKLLKEKGFREDCMAFYTKDGLFNCNSYINTNVLKLPAPTQSLAQKWLRETKNLHIEMSYMYGDYWIYDILTIPNHDLVGLADRPIVHYNTYEEALEDGIKEALILI